MLFFLDAWQVIQSKEHGYDFMFQDILKCVERPQFYYQF